LPGRSPVAVRLIAMPSSSAPALCAPLTYCCKSPAD
jgi:hypothetical protein